VQGHGSVIADGKELMEEDAILEVMDAGLLARRSTLSIMK